MTCGIRNKYNIAYRKIKKELHSLKEYDRGFLLKNLINIEWEMTAASSALSDAGNVASTTAFSLQWVCMLR